MANGEVVSIASVVAVEQRQAERVLYRDLKIWYDGCTETVDVRSPDLTTYGMFINTPRKFAEGAELKLRFDLVRTGVIVQASGQVRYCEPGVGIGVQFIALPEFARAAIEKELDIVRSEKSEVRSKN